MVRFRDKDEALREIVGRTVEITNELHPEDRVEVFREIRDQADKAARDQEDINLEKGTPER